MSARFEVNESQINALSSELTKLVSNLSTQVVKDTKSFMEDEVQDLAIEHTHHITYNLQAGWTVEESQTGESTSVKLLNRVDYAQEEFDRPGYKKSTGTPHDVRPVIQDFASANIERVVFAAVTRGLQK